MFWSQGAHYRTIGQKQQGSGVGASEKGHLLFGPHCCTWCCKQPPRPPDNGKRSGLPPLLVCMQGASLTILPYGKYALPDHSSEFPVVHQHFPAGKLHISGTMGMAIGIQDYLYKFSQIDVNLFFLPPQNIRISEFSWTRIRIETYQQHAAKRANNVNSMNYANHHLHSSFTAHDRLPGNRLQS